MCCHSGTAATQPLELSAVPVEHFSGYLLRQPMAATTSQLLSQSHWSWTGHRYALRHASDLVINVMSETHPNMPRYEAGHAQLVCPAW